jgi:uncharacterized protein (DUF1800 family)
MPIDPNDAAHLLRRAGFGGTPSQIANLAAQPDLAAAVAVVLDTSANPPVVMPPSVGNDSVEKYLQFMDMVHWWFDRMVSTPTPIVEKMTLFWHGHFTTSLSKVYEPDHIWKQHVLYRNSALGNFQAFTQAMAIEEAMLLYLDNADNRKRAPNQNFARELMELFTLGVGNYTETDVAAAAAAWSGYGYNWDARVYQFNANQHDNGNKTFFGETANFNGPQIIDKIFAAKGTIVAHYISRKMWEFFAYQNPSAAIVDALATTFIGTGWSIKELLRAIFTRPEFYSTTAKQGRVRSPIEYVVVVLKGLNATASVAAADVHPEWFTDGMGQEMFDPPDVSGWKLNKYWVSTSMLYSKARFAENCTWSLDDKNNNRQPFRDATSLTPDQLADRAFQIFGVSNPMPSTRAVLVDWATKQKAAQYQGWFEPYGFLTLSMLMPDLMMA